jgi:nicotinamidase/pyrazinamidase
MVARRGASTLRPQALSIQGYRADEVGKRILWDVDTQVDFMEPAGKLYVPGAEQTAPAMGRLVAATRAANVLHVASADDHELTDPEIGDAPDFRNTYPPHCLRGTRGAEKIAETKQRDPLPLSLVPYPPGLIPRLLEGKDEILLLKKNFDVFTNPNTDPLLAALDPDEIVVFGVATDVCDDAAILGFLQRGRRVVFVEDAARGLDEQRTRACTTAWRDRGVRFSTVEEVVGSLG